MYRLDSISAVIILNSWIFLGISVMIALCLCLKVPIFNCYSWCARHEIEQEKFLVPTSYPAVSWINPWHLLCVCHFLIVSGKTSWVGCLFRVLPFYLRRPVRQTNARVIQTLKYMPPARCSLVVPDTLARGPATRPHCIPPVHVQLLSSYACHS